MTDMSFFFRVLAIGIHLLVTINLAIGSQWMPVQAAWLGIALSIQIIMLVVEIKYQ